MKSTKRRRTLPILFIGPTVALMLAHLACHMPTVQPTLAQQWHATVGTLAKMTLAHRCMAANGGPTLAQQPLLCQRWLDWHQALGLVPV